ncbi:MAG TPA: hypothetical protein EYN66_18280, partial [Myxococcales bacterium]|nr:hypothetical protein [Myxococcales bacterium]
MDSVNKRTLQQRLSDSPDWLFSAVAMFAAFATYFCMYAFRKPFTASGYTDLQFFGTAIELKTALVVSQLIGYTLSKFIGIKVISELTAAHRPWMIIALAFLSLILFAVLPVQWKFVAIFLNGVPLGMVWGLVVSYMEGRKSSDLLLAGLACSFILASGVVKDVGRWLIRDMGFTEFWMPAATGAMFLIPFGLAVWLLEQLPKPTEEDKAIRCERTAMTGPERWAFIRTFFGGLVLLVIFYLLLSAYRDYRDNYQLELFQALNYGDEPAIFSFSETLVAFGVMLVMGVLNLIKSNSRGFFASYIVMALGLILIGVSGWLLRQQQINGLTWMVCTGLGSYLAYVPFNTLLFERMMAYTRFGGTAVFAIYLADSAGYTGSVALQLYKDMGKSNVTRLDFFL